MKQDADKTKSELISELESLRARIHELEERVGLEMSAATDADGRALSSSDGDTIKAFDWEYLHQERIKELQGIIGLGQLIDQDLDIHAFFNIFVHSIVPKSMQFSEDVVAVVKFDGREYSNSGTPPATSLTAPINVGSVQRGEIIVGYNKNLPFIPDFEQRLVNTYANRIGYYLSRIETQQRLQESEHRFRMLADNAQHVVYRMAVPSGVFEYISPSCMEVFGYSSEEFEENPQLIRDVVHPDWRQYLQEHWERACNGEGADFFEYMIVHKNGETLWLNQRNVYLMDDAGQVCAMEGIITDVTERKQILEALRESERRLALATASAGIGTWVWDIVKDEMHWDERIFRLYGISEIPEDYGLDFWQGCLHPEDRERAGEACMAAVRGEKEYDVEFRVLWPDGTVRWMQANGTVVRDKDGKPIRMLGTNYDITDRKEAGAALVESEQRFRALHNASFGGITIHDKGVIIECNQGLSDITGYSYDELVGMDGLRLIAEHSLPEVRRNISTGYEEPYEVYGRRKNGEEYPVRLEARNIPYKGKMVRVVEFRDITDQKRAENALQENEKRFRELLNDMEMVSVQGYDEERRVIYWNLASEKLYGWTQQEALNRKLEDLIIPESMQGDVIRAISKWIHEGEPIPAGELNLRHKDGSVVPVYSSHIMRENIDGNKEMFCVDIDLKDIKKAQKDLIRAKEAAEEANKTKSEFLANMSHEIRTPMNGILGMLQLLQTTSQNMEQKEYTRTAIQSSKRLTRLLSDILDLSRVEANRLSIQPQPFNLAEVVGQTCELFKPMAQQARIDLLVHVDPEIPHILNGDAARLQQVLTNLIGNALKFTKEGRISIEASSLASSDKNTVGVLFNISDTGIGIPDDKIETLFRPFTQVSEGYRREYQGAGLGLSICKKLVELMGGNIALESELGKGTAVHFCITFNVEEQTQKAEATTTAPGRSRPQRILLAEDEHVNLLATTRLLEKHGHTVKAVENGQEAISHLKEGHFDVVLMDIQMPVLDGFEATTAIRQGMAGEHNQSIPIIAMTAYAMGGDRERFLAAGMNDYIAKPVDMEQLETLIQQISTKGTEGDQHVP